MNVVELLAQRAQEAPHAAALLEDTRSGTRSLTFEQLERASGQAARMLARAGLRAGNAVLVLQPMGIELYVALLALFRLGAVAMFVDLSAGREHIDACCDLVRPQGLIASPRAHLLRLLSAPVRRIALRFCVGLPLPGARHFTAYRREPAVHPIEALSAATPALISLTSGSAGKPKAAVRSHGFLLAQHKVLQQCLNGHPGEVYLPALPMFVLSHLACGATSVIPCGNLSRPGRAAGGPVIGQITRHHVTRILASPAFVERIVACCEATSLRLPGVREVFTGGGPVFPSLLQRLQGVMPAARLVAAYGSTEAEPIAHVAWNELTRRDLEAMGHGAGLLAGRPVPQIDLRIVPDCSGRPLKDFDAQQFAELGLPARAVGEIVVRGEHVLRGYLGWHREETTKWSVDERVWHRTGDLGYLDDAGRLWLMGRSDAVVHDERGTVYPFAVETAARRHAFVQRAALASVRGKRLLCVELARNASPAQVQALETDLKWARLDEVQSLPTLPTDHRHNSKIDYPALRRLLERRCLH